tara:strand:+ start:1038 stop:1250 length:213 start_codon:yes stop_codon:yes gene_type:complete
LISLDFDRLFITNPREVCSATRGEAGFYQDKNDNLKPFSISATEAECCLETKEKNHFSLSQIRIAFRQTD